MIIQIVPYWSSIQMNMKALKYVALLVLTKTYCKQVCHKIKSSITGQTQRKAQPTGHVWKDSAEPRWQIQNPGSGMDIFFEYH